MTDEGCLIILCTIIICLTLIAATAAVLIWGG